MNEIKQSCSKFGVCLEARLDNKLAVEDSLSDLRNLKQVTSVQDYINSFAKLYPRACLREEQVVGLFLSGLNDALQVPVKMFKPTSLADTYALAKLQEFTFAPTQTEFKSVLTPSLNEFSGLVHYAPNIEEVVVCDINDSAINSFGYSDESDLYSYGSMHVFSDKNIDENKKLGSGIFFEHKKDDAMVADLFEFMVISKELVVPIASFLFQHNEGLSLHHAFLQLKPFDPGICFMALSHLLTTTLVAIAFLDNVYKIHGMPHNIPSDRGSTFLRNFWKEFFQLQGVQLRYSTTYHSQTNGHFEVVTRCLQCYLRCVASDLPHSWVQWIPLAQFWYNSTFHSSIKMSPFEALFGFPPPIHMPYSLRNSNVDAVDIYLRDRESTIARLQHHLQIMAQRKKSQADKHRTYRNFEIGDWVYLKLQLYGQTSVWPRHQRPFDPGIFIHCFGAIYQLWLLKFISAFDLFCWVFLNSLWTRNLAGEALIREVIDEWLMCVEYFFEVADMLPVERVKVAALYLEEEDIVMVNDGCRSFTVRGDLVKVLLDLVKKKKNTEVNIDGSHCNNHERDTHGHHEEHHHDHKHDSAVSSVSIVFVGTLDLDELDDWLESLIEEIRERISTKTLNLRCIKVEPGKDLVEVATGHLFQYARECKEIQCIVVLLGLHWYSTFGKRVGCCYSKYELQGAIETLQVKQFGSFILYCPQLEGIYDDNTDSASTITLLPCLEDLVSMHHFPTMHFDCSWEGPSFFLPENG